MRIVDNTIKFASLILIDYFSSPKSSQPHTIIQLFCRGITVLIKSFSTMKYLFTIVVLFITLHFSTQVSSQNLPPPPTSTSSNSFTSTSTHGKEVKDKKMGIGARLRANEAKLKAAAAAAAANASEPSSITADDASTPTEFDQFIDALNDAEQALDEGDNAAAKSSLLSAAEHTDPNNQIMVLTLVEAMFELADKTEDNELAQKAVELIEQYESENPDDGEFAFEIAYFAYEIDQNSFASNYFVKAVNGNYNVAESAYMVASTLALDSQEDDAISWLSYALQSGYLQVLEQSEEASDYISTDSDLASLRDLQAYKDLQSEYGF